MKIMQDGDNGQQQRPAVVGKQMPTKIERRPEAIAAEMEYVRKLYMLTKSDVVTTERLVGEMMMPATNLIAADEFETRRARAEAVLDMAEHLAMAYIDRVKVKIGDIKADGWDVRQNQ